MILEKIRLPSKIKEDEITEDLAKRLRNFDEEIVASDIQDWKRIINPAKNKKQKNPRASILITFHETYFLRILFAMNTSFENFIQNERVSRKFC